MRNWLRLCRPKQWLKNILVFAGPAAAGVLNQREELLKSVVMFVAFCLTASGLYCWNDAIDADKDRLHPKKRLRPIAAGNISTSSALAVGSLLIVLGVAAAGFARIQAAEILVVYVILTLVYSYRLKHVAIIDLAIVSSGFVLRAISGAVVTDQPMSKWFILCTLFGSFFIVTGKRYAELSELGVDAGSTRASLGEYSLDFLRMLLGIACSATLVAYCVYAFEIADTVDASIPYYEVTVVPMALALFRYLLVLSQGKGGAPEEVFLSDRVLQLLGASWVFIFGLAVYVR